VAVSLPLICDFSYGFSFPRRLTYPRTLMMVALSVPNVNILIASTKYSQLHRLEVCLKHAGDFVTVCGILPTLRVKLSAESN
jgi:hypothetical protein